MHFNLITLKQNLWRLLAALAICLAAAAPAHAKKGIGIINTGDELFEVADFPADVLEKFQSAKASKVGYKCGHFGIFWADVWTWDCKMVATMGDNSYADLPAELSTRLSSDPQYAFSKAQRSFWNKYAFWTFIVLGAAVLVWSARSKSSPGDEAAA